MLHASVILASVPPKLPEHAPRKATNAVGLFSAMVGVFVLLVVGAALALRVRWRRAHMRRAIGVGGAAPRAGGIRVDPWTEAGRRLAVESGAEDDDAGTVDLDPRDLGPDDIEPGDSGVDGRGG